MRTAFVYTGTYGSCNYSVHPLKMVDLKSTCELIQAFGLFTLSSSEKIATGKASDGKDAGTFPKRIAFYFLMAFGLAWVLLAFFRLG